MDLEESLLYDEYKFACLFAYYILDCDFFKFLSKQLNVSNLNIINDGIEEIVLNIRDLAKYFPLDTKQTLLYNDLLKYKNFLSKTKSVET